MRLRIKSLESNDEGIAQFAKSDVFQNFYMKSKVSRQNKRSSTKLTLQWLFLQIDDSFRSRNSWDIYDWNVVLLFFWQQKLYWWNKALIITDVVIVHRGSLNRCGWTFNRLSRDGVTLKCWSHFFASLHQAMRSIVYVSQYLAPWCTAIGAFRYSLEVVPSVGWLGVVQSLRFCSLSGLLRYLSAVLFLDIRHPCLWNFDSTSPAVDVVWMESYMYGLFNPSSCNNEGLCQ